MLNLSLLDESKTLFASWLKNLEVSNAGGDVEQLARIAATSDDEIVKRWLWTATIYGAPSCFIALPIALWLLSFIFMPLIMEILWFFAKLAMTAVFAAFGFAVLLTFRESRDHR